MNTLIARRIRSVYLQCRNVAHVNFEFLAVENRSLIDRLHLLVSARTFRIDVSLTICRLVGVDAISILDASMKNTFVA